MDLQLTHEKLSTNFGFYLLDSRKPWSHDTSYPGVSLLNLQEVQV